jgi:hypothetical protein
MAGMLLLGYAQPQFSQRSVINLGFLFDNSFPFINFLSCASSFLGPSGSSFATGTLWPEVIDADGWPNAAGASGRSFGGGIRIPGSDKYTGKWVITWDGDGRINLDTGTWTVDTGLSTNYVQNANGRYSNSSFGVGSSPRVVVTLTGATGDPLIGLQVQLTDPNGVGAYLRNLKFYQLGDEADLQAGYIFRSAFKQSLVDLNPSAIRFMNWAGGSAATMNRFENRSLPSLAGYSYSSNWVASPVYPAASGTNRYSVATATPTAANPKTTPASLTHGELVTARFTTGTIRTGARTISAITNAASNPQVTTSSAHGYSTGDVIVCQGVVGGTFTRLEHFPCEVTVVDTTKFTLAAVGGGAVDTSGYGTFTSGTCTQYLSLDVAGRGARPIAWHSASQNGSTYGIVAGGGANDIIAGSYYTMFYDKNVAIESDGAGNWIYGAWMFSPSSNGWRGEVPLEIMVSLVNEINEMSVAQGITNPVHMWHCIAHTGMQSMDSDYDVDSDLAVKSVDVILNGANGYPGLTANAQLFLEYSNETWNGAAGFWANFYLTRMGYLRWPSAGTTNAVDMPILRSTIMMKAVEAAHGLSRIKRVLGGWGFVGYSAGQFNYLRVNGSTTPGQAGNYYMTDPLATGFGAPILSHDCYATATYFDGHSSYYGGTGTGSFTDDSAMYAGTTPYSSPDQTQAITNFVAKIKTNAGQDIDAYLNDSLSGLTADYAAAMYSLGKVAINYEGGADWQCAVGQSLQAVHTITAADRTFCTAVLNSTQWRDAQVGYFNRTSQLLGSAMPAVFTYVGGTNDQRWSYCSPDTFTGTTEGQALLDNPTWVGMSDRNQALSP